MNSNPISEGITALCFKHRIHVRIRRECSPATRVRHDRNGDECDSLQFIIRETTIVSRDIAEDFLIGREASEDVV